MIDGGLTLPQVVEDIHIDGAQFHRRDGDARLLPQLPESALHRALPLEDGPAGDLPQAAEGLLRVPPGDEDLAVRGDGVDLRHQVEGPRRDGLPPDQVEAQEVPRPVIGVPELSFHRHHTAALSHGSRSRALRTVRRMVSPPAPRQ